MQTVETNDVNVKAEITNRFAQMELEHTQRTVESTNAMKAQIQSVKDPAETEIVNMKAHLTTQANQREQEKNEFVAQVKKMESEANDTKAKINLMAVGMTNMQNAMTAELNVLKASAAGGGMENVFTKKD